MKLLHGESRSLVTMSVEAAAFPSILQRSPVFHVGAVDAKGARWQRLLAKAAFLALSFSEAFALATLARLSFALALRPVTGFEEHPAKVLAGVLDGFRFVVPGELVHDHVDLARVGVKVQKVLEEAPWLWSP